MGFVRLFVYQLFYIINMYILYFNDLTLSLKLNLIVDVNFVIYIFL